MQQLNIKFLNPPEPGPEDRYVEKALRAIALARAWASEARAAGLLLSPAAGSDLRALLALIGAREVLEPEVGALAQKRREFGGGSGKADVAVRVPRREPARPSSPGEKCEPKCELPPNRRKFT